MVFKKIHIIRIKPDEEILAEILRYCQKKKIASAVIISLLGSLKEVDLGFLKKLPGKFITKKIKGPLEIASGTGTVATKDGKIVLHIHLVVSSEKQAIAGHLAAGKVFSTAEVVIAEIEEKLERYADSFTGLNELKGK